MYDLDPEKLRTYRKAKELFYAENNGSVESNATLEYLQQYNARTKKFNNYDAIADYTTEALSYIHPTAGKVASFVNDTYSICKGIYLGNVGAVLKGGMGILRKFGLFKQDPGVTNEQLLDELKKVRVEIQDVKSEVQNVGLEVVELRCLTAAMNESVNIIEQELYSQGVEQYYLRQAYRSNIAYRLTRAFGLLEIYYNIFDPRTANTQNTHYDNYAKAMDALEKMPAGQSAEDIDDDLDYYSSAGAFFNGAMGAIYIPSLLLAALIVKDRPLSSYFSSGGGWRWKIFLKTFAAVFVIFGIPVIIKFLLNGKSGDVRFTAGGFIFLILFMPATCIAEELMFRGFMMQTAGSWFRLPVIGLIVQTIAFAAAHPYNLTGIIYIAVSAVIYGLICIYSGGIEASSALHILNNLIELIMGGLGFGKLGAEQTLSSTLIIIVLKLLFLAFIIYADKKLHRFDEVQYDDIGPFNAKYDRKNAS